MSRYGDPRTLTLRFRQSKGKCVYAVSIRCVLWLVFFIQNIINWKIAASLITVLSVKPLSSSAMANKFLFDGSLCSNFCTKSNLYENNLKCSHRTFHNTYTWPDLTVCDFFQWDYIKDSVYIPPSSDIARIENAQLQLPGMLEGVWYE